MKYFSKLERQATMAFGNLRSVLRIFGGSSANEKTQDELYREVLMMTLAEASMADANIHPLEIEAIQQIMQRETGQDLTEADIRVASRSDVYRSANLLKYLRRARFQLNAENKATILQALVDVITSDTKINVLEIDFFNRVVKALRMSPAEQQGLTT
jgi:uncharacterized tellurite resistance protein B-like protein